MAEMWRLFIAIELPRSVLDVLSEAQARLRRDSPPRAVRWVNPNGIHLTLKFLGDVPLDQRAEIEQRLTQIARQTAPLEIAIQGLGCFPNCRRPRVVWAVVHEPSGALLTLRDAVEAYFAKVAAPTENRPFSPHLTLGRAGREASPGDVGRVGTLVANYQPAPSARWQADAISLMRSELKPDGAVYTALLHAPLVAE